MSSQLGERLLQRLQASEIDALYVQLLEKMAARTAHHVHTVLGARLGTAARTRKPLSQKSDAGTGKDAVPW